MKETFFLLRKVNSQKENWEVYLIVKGESYTKNQISLKSPQESKMQKGITDEIVYGN